MKNKALPCFLIIILFLGCRASVKNDLINEINHKCKGEGQSECTIDLNSITKFRWDWMYIFPDWTMSDSISKIIGFYYAGGDVPNDYSRILFTQGNKVVYEEDSKSFESGNVRIELQGLVDSFSRVRRFQLASKRAIFKAKKDASKSACSECVFYALSLAK